MTRAFGVDRSVWRRQRMVRCWSATTARGRFGELLTPGNKQLAVEETRMNRITRATCLASFTLVAVALSQAQLADKKALTLQIAKQVAAAAEQAAAANHNHM